MDENNKLPIAIRIIDAIGGLFGGAIIGMIFVAAIMPISDNAFGLIWPIIIFCALIGLLLGFFYPRIALIFLPPVN